MTSSLRRLLLGSVFALAAGPAFAQEQVEPAAPVPAPPAPPAVVEEMDALSFVTWASASVRAAPSGTAELQETLPFGAQVIVTGRLAVGGWVRVQTPKTPVGYMWAQTLAPMRITLPGTVAPGAGAPGLAPADESADDNIAGATPLGAVGPAPLAAEGRVSRSDETDVYSITTTGWTDLTVELTGMTGDADLELRDGDGNSLGSSSAGGSDDERMTTSVGPGSYYLVVTSYDEDTPYRLSVSGTPGEPPPPDSAGSSQSDAHDLGDVTGGSAEAGDWVGPADSVDYYVFRIRERQAVTIGLDGMSADADINLESDDGTLLSGTNADAEAESLTATLDPGTYYLNVYPADGEATEYRVTVTGADAPPPPPDGAGNTPDAAGTIERVGPEPATVRDWVGFTDRDDYWRFTLVARADVTIRLTMEQGDADIDLLRASDQESLISGANSGTDPEELKLRLEPGTYLLRVYSYQGDTPYTLEAKAVPTK
ncbi:pre-peptidase C-terminal domain-containing protein [Inquilinus limosus]|uniref:pre-peptidase C-terminal domain-containing protein n=1 Tax=Inquilinus limosus TaxID=171674 RepID=UPI000479E6C0|nr:pre-peptidase C-terminal domain-containing protein [Inquilinus limosus]